MSDTNTVPLTGLSDVTELITAGGILCAISGGNIYLFDFAAGAWPQIGGPGTWFCTDGQYIWGGGPEGINIFTNPSWPAAFAPPSGDTISGIVAANGVLYVELAQGGTTGIPASSSQQQFPVSNKYSGTLIASQKYLYACSSSQISEYDPAANAWLTDLVAPQGVQFSTTILTAENQVLVLGSDNNLYGYDSKLRQSLPLVAGYSSSSSSITIRYAFTALALVALTSAGNLYYSNPRVTQNTW